MLLAQGTLLTAAVNDAIAAKALLQHVLLPHFGAIKARVTAWATNHTGNKRVQRSTGSTSCNTKSPPHILLINQTNH